jgi:protocatechuate 3,4-dioxygenase beta subunit
MGARHNRPMQLDSSRSRRDFLAWLAAVPAVAACTAETGDASHDDPSPDEVPPGEETVDTYEQEQVVCRYTSRDATGPYYEPGSPVRTRIAALTEPGVPLLVEGRLFGPGCQTPLRGYPIDVWQADANGNYYAAGQSNYRLRGKVKTDAFGRYRFETILPGRYGDAAGIRPAHLHVRMLTPLGGVLLTTQLYFAGDPFLGQADYCTRQGTCNSADPRRALTLSNQTFSGRPGKRALFNAYLTRS